MRGVQLTIAINFVSSKDVNEERVMHSKSDNKEFMTDDLVANDVIDELFESLISKYQSGLETSMRGSEFTFRSNSIVSLQMSQYKF